MTLLTILVVLMFAYSLVSARIERSVLTAPMVFTAAGLVVYAITRRVPAWHGDQEFFLRLAEIGLVLLLFTDASRTRLAMLRRIQSLPTRLLTIGMLLTLLLGGLAALGIFPHLTIWEAGILAAILAPTDAGLGQIIVNSPQVPVKIRQALNVEAGLNDGLSVPFLLFFLALNAGGGGNEDAHLARHIYQQLGVGVVVGAGLGLVGGGLLGWARRREGIATEWLQLGVVTLPLICGLASEGSGTSMFIAAFVAGLAVQVGFPEAGKHSVEFTEEWGQALNLAVFFLFGLLVGRAWPELKWTHAAYAVISLTLVRMLPVAVALAGTRLSRATVGFMGWFGPRGLASIVLGLVYLEQVPATSQAATIKYAVMTTVLISIFAHGLSALPGITAYARTVERLPATAPELSENPPSPSPSPAPGPHAHS